MNTFNAQCAVLRRPAVEAITGLSRSTIYQKMDPKSKYYDVRFPKQIRLGKKSVGWMQSSIYSYIEACVNDS